MHIQITARQFTASENLREHARTRIERLRKYYDGITGVHVILSRNGMPESSAAEISANVHKQQLVAHATATTHEEAIDECVERLKRQVKRFKEKLRDVNKDQHR